jgi:3-hydroxyacyl-[acyl-carrier protein] dehydratase/trans-2-decenoyl-[acyl-carrier protein] isomerase
LIVDSDSTDTNPAYKQSQFSKEELLRMAEGELFGLGSPLLPRPQMLMIDRITHIATTGGKHSKGLIEAELDIQPDLWFFGCHFKGDPVMPGCLGLDGMWQLMGYFLAWSGFKGKGRALGVKDLNFTGQVLPENKLVSYRLDIRRVVNMRLKMIVADGELSVDGKKIYEAASMRVGIFND